MSIPHRHINELLTSKENRQRNESMARHFLIMDHPINHSGHTRFQTGRQAIGEGLTAELNTLW